VKVLLTVAWWLRGLANPGLMDKEDIYVKVANKT
jgi:hypothetical protein